MYDAVLISDLHLGSPYCLHDRLKKFLKNLPRTRRLFILGDLVDNPAGPFTKGDWEVMSLLREADVGGVVWVLGNHDGYQAGDLLATDGQYEMAKLLGVTYVHKGGLALQSGSKTFYLTHGHEYDEFLTRHKRLSRYLNRWYLIAHCVSPALGRWIKRRVLVASDCTASAILGTQKVVEANKYHAAISGHTHHRMGRGCYLRNDGTALPNLHYYNLGCWTEEAQTCYATLLDGKIELHTFE